MKMDRLKEVLAAEPPPREVALRAARARQRALASFHAAPAAQDPGQAAPWAAPLRLAAALVVVLAGAGLVSFRAPQASVKSEARPAAAPNGARLEVNFQLSDGTKVRWVFNEDFAL
jgi:ferric-dicitrate binding protein FerR (iron transport regulator)